jgi:hypothetical protein
MRRRSVVDSGGLTVSAGGIAITGASTFSSTINSQTISSAASFTGSVAIATTLAVTGQVSIGSATASSGILTTRVADGNIHRRLVNAAGSNVWGEYLTGGGLIWTLRDTLGNADYLALSTSVFTVSTATTAVQALTATTLTITGGAGASITRGSATTLTVDRTGSTGTIVSFTYGTEKASIDTSGALTLAAGITAFSVPSSSYGFQIVDNGSGSAPNVKIGANGTSGLNLMLFINGNGTVGSIAVSGSATAFNTSSDRDLKIDRGIATTVVTLRDLVVHDFDWKIDGRADRGVFAQEAYKVKPSAVSVGDDTVDANGNKANPWAVDYSKFVPDLIVGWQDHDKKINDHEHRLQMLEVRA